jgi:hypothetical protein
MDGTGEAKKTFEALGISVEEANKLSGDQFAILGLVADRLNLVTNSTDKLKFAIEIFGGRGAELINVLKGGSEQIEEFRKQAEQFGALNEDQVKQVEDLNDSIVRLKTSFGNITNQIVANLAPALTGLIDDFNESLTTTETGESRIKELGQTLSLTIIRAVRSSLQALDNLVSGFENAFLKLKIFEKDPIFFFKKDIENFSDLNRELQLQEQILERARREDAGFINLDDGRIMLVKQFAERVEELREFIRDAKEEGFGFNSTFGKSIQVLNDLEANVINANNALENTSVINREITLAENIIKTNANVDILHGSLEDLHAQFRETFQPEPVSQLKIKMSDLRVGAFDVLIKTTESLSESFAQVFTDAIFRVRSLKEGMQELARTIIMQLVKGLIQIGLQVFVFDPLLKKIRSMADEEKKVNDQLRTQIGLRLILSLFGGGRANGGQVEGASGGRASGGYVQGSRPMGGATGYGKAYMVGERGAELFVPDQDGTIIPNDKLGGTTNINFTINAVDTRGFRALLRNERGTIVNMINQAVTDKGRMAVI